MIWLVKSAVCALYPGSDNYPALHELDVDSRLRQLKRDSSRMFWLGVVAGALVFAISPVLTVGLPLPAFLLPRGARDRHSDRVSAHPWYLLRQAVFLVKLVGGLCWGEHAAVRKVQGLAPYEPDPGTWRNG